MLTWQNMELAVLGLLMHQGHGVADELFVYWCRLDVRGNNDSMFS